MDVLDARVAGDAIEVVEVKGVGKDVVKGRDRGQENQSGTRRVLDVVASFAA